MLTSVFLCILIQLGHHGTLMDGNLLEPLAKKAKRAMPELRLAFPREREQPGAVDRLV